MSRIQQVLDKAEIEGAMRRTRAVTPSVGVPVSPRAPGHSRTVAVTLDARLLAGRAPTSPTAEQYRALRTRLDRVDRRRTEHVMLVTSPGPAEGRSLTVANLGLTMAQDRERRICILDADLRHSSQHTLFGIPETPGLCDVILGRAPLDDAIVTVADAPNLSLCPAGTPPAHPAEVLGTNAMHRVLQALRARFDCVLVDAPAVTQLADVGILAPLVDGIVVVVRAGFTTRPAIRDAIGAIDPGRLLGIVLNDAR
jgi:capsular exopolysaccharide synthesis family protein